jgi:hypothetical protein
MKFTTGLQVSIVLLFGLAAGCDASKPELDKTKAQLQQITADRDSLKGQLETADAKIVTCQQQVTTLQTAAKAATDTKTAEKPATKLASKKKPSRHHRHR